MKKIILIIICVWNIFASSQTFSQDEQTKSIIISKTENSITLKEPDGSTVTIKKRPQRVISCYTSFVSLWYLSGGSLIAMPETNHPSLNCEPYSTLESIGAVTAPNAEKILSLKPDLVLLCSQMEKHRALNNLLKKTNIDSVLLEYKNFYDFKLLLELFSEINGKDLSENQNADNILKQVENIISKAPKNQKIKFLSLFTSAAKTPNAETSNANTALIAKMLGAENIIEKIKYPKNSISINLSSEKIIEENPDIILITMMGDEKIIKEKIINSFQNDPLWNSLSAIKNNNIHFLPSELFLYKANEKYPDAFSYLFNILYGKNQTKVNDELR